MNEAAELLSLFLTIPTIIYALAVAYLYGRSAWGNLSSLSMGAREWMILGVVVSFVTDSVDNSWWGIAWTFFHADDPRADWWFDNGVFCNVPFRQGGGIVAAWCHIKAVRMMFNHGEGILRYLDLMAWGGGSLFLLYLLL